MENVHIVTIPAPSRGAAASIDPVALANAVNAYLSANTDIVRRTDADFQALKDLDLDLDSKADMAETLDETMFTATILTAGQTSFTLPATPQQPLFARLFLNNEPFTYSNTTFEITGATLEWKHPAVQLEPSDNLILMYR